MASSFESVFKLLSADVDSLSDPDLQDYAALQIAGLINSERKNNGVPALARDELCDRAAGDVLSRPTTSMHTTVKNHSVIGTDFNFVNLEQQCTTQLGSSKASAVDYFKGLLNSLDANGRRTLFGPSITHFGIAAERNSASIYRVCIIVFRKALTIFHISHRASEGIIIHGKFLDPHYSLYAVAVHDERNSTKAGFAGPKQIQYNLDTQDFTVKVGARLMPNRTLTCKVLEFLAVQGDPRSLNYGSGQDIMSVNEHSSVCVHKMRFLRLWESNLLYEARPLSDSLFVLDEYNSKSNIPKPSTVGARPSMRTPSWAGVRGTPLKSGSTVNRPLPTISELSRSQHELPHWSQTDRNKPEVVTAFPSVGTSFGAANENMNPIVEPDRFPPRSGSIQGLPNTFGSGSYSSFPSKPLTINTALTPTNSNYSQQPSSQFSFVAKPGQASFPTTAQPQSSFPGTSTFPTSSSFPQGKPSFPAFPPQSQASYPTSGYHSSSTQPSFPATQSGYQPSAFPTTSNLGPRPATQFGQTQANPQGGQHPYQVSAQSAFPTSQSAFPTPHSAFPTAQSAFPTSTQSAFPSSQSAFPTPSQPTFTSAQPAFTTSAQSAFPTTAQSAFQGAQSAFPTTTSQSAFPSASRTTFPPQPTPQASFAQPASFTPTAVGTSAKPAFAPSAYPQTSSFPTTQTFKPSTSQTVQSSFFVSNDQRGSVKVADNFDRYLTDSTEESKANPEYVNLSCLILAIPRKLFEEVRTYVVENPSYRKLYETMEYSDVIIRVQNCDVRAHRAVLCASSSYLREQLDRIKAIPSSLQVAKLVLPSSFTETAFKIALKFMYSLNIDQERIDLPTAKELLTVAETLGLPALVKVTVVKFVCTQITREDVLSTLRLATVKNDPNTQQAWEYLEDSCALFAAQQSQWLVRNRRAECLSLPLNLLFRVLEYSIAHANSSEQVANVIKLLTDLRYADNVFELADKLSNLYLLGYKDYSCDIRQVDMLRPYTRDQLARLNPSSLMEHPNIEDHFYSSQSRLTPTPPPLVPASVNTVVVHGERSSQLAIAVGSSAPKTATILKDRDLRARSSKPSFTFTVSDLSRPKTVISSVFSSLSRLWSLVFVIEQSQHISLYLCERGTPEDNQSPLLYTSVLYELEIQDPGLKEARVCNQPNYSACFFSFPNGQGFSAGERNYCRLSQLRDHSKAVVAVYIKEVNLHSSLLHYIASNCDTLFSRNSEAFCSMNAYNIKAILSHDQLNVKTERDVAKVLYYFASKQPAEVVDIVITALRLQLMPLPDLLNIVRDHTRIRQSQLFQKLFEAEMTRRLSGQPQTEIPRNSSKQKPESTQVENLKALTQWLLTAPHHEGYERRLDELKQQIQTSRVESDKKIAELHASRLELAKELERTRSMSKVPRDQEEQQETKSDCSVM
mmetsp:Transcript_845/g.1954  ORF Transcript_845/g.1954 Transcript_845/m.1954 type:complete len:1413 (-) Transcript_845:617-4855(-)